MSGRHETPDPRPMAVPVGFTAPPSLIEMIRTYVRRELSQNAVKHQAESFEEADDFDVPDDPVDPSSPWELNFDQAAAPFEVEPSPAPAGAAPAPAAGSDAPPPPSPPEASSPKPP